MDAHLYVLHPSLGIRPSRTPDKESNTILLLAELLDHSQSRSSSHGDTHVGALFASDQQNNSGMRHPESAERYTSSLSKL